MKHKKLPIINILLKCSTKYSRLQQILGYNMLSKDLTAIDIIDYQTYYTKY